MLLARHACLELVCRTHAGERAGQGAEPAKLFVNGCCKLPFWRCGILCTDVLSLCMLALRWVGDTWEQVYLLWTEVGPEYGVVQVPYTAFGMLSCIDERSASQTGDS